MKSHDAHLSEFISGCFFDTRHKIKEAILPSSRIVPFIFHSVAAIRLFRLRFLVSRRNNSSKTAESFSRVPSAV